MIVPTSPTPPVASPPHPGRPRVLLLVNKLGGGGAERDVSVMCRHADSSSFAFEVWTLLGGGDLEPIVRDAGVTIHCLDRRRAYDPVFALRAAREIARADFDLIHTMLPAVAFYGALAKVLWRSPSPLIYSELSAFPKKGLKTTLRTWAIRHCDAFCANSLGSQQYLEYTGVDSAKIRLVPNGHDVDRYQTMTAPRETVRASLGVAPDDRLAIYVGRLIPSKRVCDLLDATARLKRDGRPVRVLVVGEGPERERLEQQSAALGLASTVRFAGRRLDIPDLLQAADMFVFPSETEGLSNAVIEAALAGLPIVACDIGGVREIVLDGDGAYLVPVRQPEALARAVTQVLDDPEQATQRARRSHESAVNEYAIERVMQRLYTIYEEVLHAKSRGSS